MPPSSVNLLFVLLLPPVGLPRASATNAPAHLRLSPRAHRVQHVSARGKRDVIGLVQAPPSATSWHRDVAQRPAAGKTSRSLMTLLAYFSRLADTARAARAARHEPLIGWGVGSSPTAIASGRPRPARRSGLLTVDYGPRHNGRPTVLTNCVTRLGGPQRQRSRRLFAFSGPWKPYPCDKGTTERPPAEHIPELWRPSELPQ